MTIEDGSHWHMCYANPRSTARMLISAPPEMLRDIRILAKSQGISMAELFRREVTKTLARAVQERPEIAASYRGQPQTAHE